jgi:hypothetical protein
LNEQRLSLSPLQKEAEKMKKEEGSEEGQERGGIKKRRKRRKIRSRKGVEKLKRRV